MIGYREDGKCPLDGRKTNCTENCADCEETKTTYKVTAKTPKGNLTVEVEGESRFLCLNLAQRYFRAAFGDDFEMSWEKV